MRYISTTGTRQVNIEAGDDGVVGQQSNNHVSRYWSRESDENYLRLVESYEEGEVELPWHPRDVSLYFFASAFTKEWYYSGHELCFVVPTPTFHYIPRFGTENGEVSEFHKLYCESMILLHKPGCNRENMLDKSDGEKFSNVQEAYEDFVRNDSHCPKFVQRDYLNFLDPWKDSFGDNVADELVPEDTEAMLMTNAVEQEDWMVGLGPAVNPGETEVETDQDIEDMVEIDNVPLATSEEQRAADRLSLELSDLHIKDLMGWLAEQKKSYKITNPVVETDVTSLNERQRQVYDAVMNGLEDGQLLLDLNGGAGSGKSYLIKTILKDAEERWGKGSVRIAAPTGCAAVQFNGGRTIHSLLKIPVKRGTDNRMEKLEAGPLRALQDELKSMKMLIIDEKVGFLCIFF